MKTAGDVLQNASGLVLLLTVGLHHAERDPLAGFGLVFFQFKLDSVIPLDGDKVQIGSTDSQ